MNVTISASKACGTVFAPPSKSIAHRMLICAALSNGTSTISGISQSQDMLATMDCLKTLGASIDLSGDTATITGFKNKIAENPVFPCRESGSTLRFLIPLALKFCKNSEFVGTQRLISRGIGIYKDIFSDKNIEISEFSDKIQFSGNISPDTYYVPGNISSQFVSGLLFALPLLDQDSKISVLPPVESKPYIDMTVDVMKNFGCNISNTGNNYDITPQSYTAQNTSVEGDWSNSAFFFALNSIGSDVTVNGLNYDSLQGDKIVLEHIKSLEKANSVIDLSNCPDLAPVLFALAAIKNGATFTGTKRLKIKESDRAEVMKEELLKFGIDTIISENSVKIMGGTLTQPTEILDGHNDHRIVMALTLLSSVTGGQISGFEATNKSYPNFLSVIQSLGLEAKNEV